MSKFSKIKFGSGLSVTDEGAGVITVSGSGGGGTGPAGPPGPTGPTGATGATGPAGPNVVNDSTASPLVGMLKANGTDVDVAVAGTDYATPTQLSAKVDRDAVEAATNRLVQVKLAAGDTQPAFKIRGDGRHDWGQGGTAAADTNLYRPAAGRLRTDGTLDMNFGTVDFNGAGNPLSFGGGTDVQLFRLASGVLKMNGVLCAAGSVISAQALTNQIQLNADGKIYFGSAADTNLYRSGANVLKTDDSLNVGGSLEVPLDVGGGTAATALNLYASGVGLRQVFAGAADSAGAGWRVLRVAN